MAPTDGGSVHAGVDEGAERHVAADAAETVEMGRAHCLLCDLCASVVQFLILWRWG